MTPRLGFLAWEKREGWKRKRKTEEREERERWKREKKRDPGSIDVRTCGQSLILVTAKNTKDPGKM